MNFNILNFMDVKKIIQWFLALSQIRIYSKFFLWLNKQNVNPNYIPWFLFFSQECFARGVCGWGERSVSHSDSGWSTRQETVAAVPQQHSENCKETSHHIHWGPLGPAPRPRGTVLGIRHRVAAISRGWSAIIVRGGEWGCKFRGVPRRKLTEEQEEVLRERKFQGH